MLSSLCFNTLSENNFASFTQLSNLKLFVLYLFIPIDMEYRFPCTRPAPACVSEALKNKVQINNIKCFIKPPLLKYNAACEKKVNEDSLHHIIKWSSGFRCAYTSTLFFWWYSTRDSIGFFTILPMVKPNS